MAHSQRRTFVNLSVFAGSAAMFAAAWLGVVGADRAGTSVATAFIAIPATSAVATTPAVAFSDATRSAPAVTQTAQVAPAPRQVVVVRQSRAS